MEHTPTWNIEQVWGSDRFYHEGDVAEDQIAFVIDSGIAKLDDLNVNEEWSKSFVDVSDDPFDDVVGHGTAVASIIGAKANGEGLTGVAPGAELVALRVFGNTGRTSGQTVVRALEYARDVIVANNLFDKAVINMSLGGRGGDNYPIVQEMADLGIKFALAAGNSAIDVDDYSPASYGHHENVYTVSSITEDGAYSYFTNYDDNSDGVDDSDFAAPGSRVPTYNTDGTISNRNGTSFSAPHVAGLLLMSDIKAGQTFTMNENQIEKGMVADPLSMFDANSYKHDGSYKPPTRPIPPFNPAPPLDDRVKLKGDDLDNLLEGGNNRDRIFGRKGNDTIISFEGHDVIRGGSGDDYLDAGEGMDVIFTGKGADYIVNQADGVNDLLFIDRGDHGVTTIERLDAVDKIAVKDAYDHELSVAPLNGNYGIYYNDQLAAIYSSSNLSSTQLEDMMFGIT